MYGVVAYIQCSARFSTQSTNAVYKCTFCNASQAPITSFSFKANHHCKPRKSINSSTYRAIHFEINSLSLVNTKDTFDPSIYQK
jgi:hypothetical protein